MPSSGRAARIAFRNETCGSRRDRRSASQARWPFELLGARMARPVVLGQGRDQGTQLRRGIAHQRDVGLAQAVVLVGIDVEPHDLQVGIDAPVAVLDEEARADRQHRVGILPQAMADRHVDGEPVRARHDAAAAAIGADRRFQHLSEPDHLGAGLERAAAHDDDRPLGGAQDLRRRRDRLVVDRLGWQRQRRVRQRRLRRAWPRCRARIPAPPGAAGPRSRARSPARPGSGASCGLLMRSAHLVMWRIRPSWSWISCRWPWPLSMSACGIWPIRPITGAFMP